jgi:hypothetical protein
VWGGQGNEASRPAAPTPSAPAAASASAFGGGTRRTAATDDDGDAVPYTNFSVTRAAAPAAAQPAPSTGGGGRVGADTVRCTRMRTRTAARACAVTDVRRAVGDRGGDGPPRVVL